VKIFPVAICLLHVVICAVCIPNDVTDRAGCGLHLQPAVINVCAATDLSRPDREGPVLVGRDLLFLTPRSKLGLFSSLAQSPDSAEPPQPSAPSSKHPVERGYAAFYGASLEGHKTACGGVYSSAKFTAAHRTLPCGTKLRVTNLRNGKSVRVTVNDHGPTSRDRIIDLSYAAAQALDFIPQGTTLVKLEVLR
jgi:Lytic transglycolase